MASMITLGSTRSRALGEPEAPIEGCRCSYNKRTRRWVQVCPVPKSRKHRSGITFKGNCR